jgi:hypothetical protein
VVVQAQVAGTGFGRTLGWLLAAVMLICAACGKPEPSGVAGRYEMDKVRMRTELVDVELSARRLERTVPPDEASELAQRVDTWLSHADLKVGCRKTLRVGSPQRDRS